jgi:hypothetical protein
MFLRNISIYLKFRTALQPRDQHRHYEELHKQIYSSAGIVRVNKSIRTRSAEHVARMNKIINANKILMGKL